MKQLESFFEYIVNTIQIKAVIDSKFQVSNEGILLLTIYWGLESFVLLSLGESEDWKLTQSLPSEFWSMFRLSADAISTPTIIAIATK